VDEVNVMYCHAMCLDGLRKNHEKHNSEWLVFVMRFEPGTFQNSNQKHRNFNLLTAHTW